MRHKIFTGLGFEKCHSLSMQPIFKLFLKAVADSKIPDHESLIGFLLNTSLSVNQFLSVNHLMSEVVDGKFKNRCLVIHTPHNLLIHPLLPIFLLISGKW